ncbi:hypothetical protein [Kiloniella sp.]|uniref:hypothetical protein n=1 Tax=Kiloniella sp. TaxID=1938587 RepID=UPI003B0183BB
MLIVIYLLYVKLSETIHINRLLGGRHLFLLNKAEKSPFYLFRVIPAGNWKYGLTLKFSKPTIVAIRCGDYLVLYLLL